ncbi:hypothetical protein NEMBOFW57_001957 [Staphylotrichum longicolle]|uniref:Uncharacterized protein n=1 Tax=Staphylotrichum longicolle TaxID=669026 RepID=A0AAD4F2I7_9PEZI|nr:hypothetical protein NEMBOFW57_001957 [Staphylotrichum longicolle]
MVSFFGLKVGGKKKKSDGKAAQGKQQHEWKRIDQNALGEGQFFGQNLDKKGVVINGSIRSVSRAGTPQPGGSGRSPYGNYDAHNLAAASMMDLGNPAFGGSQLSLRVKPHASDANLRTRFGANNGSSTSLAVPAPGFGSRFGANNGSSTSLAAPTPGFSSRFGANNRSSSSLAAPGPGFGSRPGTPSRAKAWVNPLDVHFARSVPSGPPTPKSPLVDSMTIPPTPTKDKVETQSVFGEDAGNMVDAVMASVKKREEEANEAKQREQELEKERETARLDMERLERQKSTESTLAARRPSAPQLEPELPSAEPSLPGSGRNARARSALLATTPTGVRPTQLGQLTVNRDTSLGVGQTLKALETLAQMVLRQAFIPVILMVPPLAPTTSCSGRLWTIAGLSMKIEEFEKTLLNAQQTQQTQQTLKAEVQEPKRRSGSSSVYSDGPKIDDDDEDEGPILPAHPAPLRIPQTTAAPAPAAIDRPQSPMRGPPRRGTLPRRPGLEEYGISSTQVSLRTRGGTPTPASRSGSTDNYSNHSSPLSRTDTPQLRHPNWKRDLAQPSPAPTLENMERPRPSPVVDTFERARPAPVVDTGFNFDFGPGPSLGFAAPPTPDSSTWSLASPIGETGPIPTQTSEPAQTQPAKFTRSNVPPPLNLKFNFSADAPSRDPTLGIWTPPIRPTHGAVAPTEERPSTSGGPGGAGKSNGLAASPSFLSRFPESHGDDPSSFMGIGMARGPSIREVRRPKTSAGGKPGPVDSFGTGFI